MSSASSSTGPSPSSAAAAAAAGLKGWAQVKRAIRTIKYEHLVAGFSGGCISTLVLHPLDLLKIRFAVDDGKAANSPKYTGLKNAVTSILRTEGLRGFYKGVTPNVAGAGAAWGLYFLFYNTIKFDMQKGDSKFQLSPGYHMLAAAQAGIITLALTNPIWVVKTRLCLQYENAHLVKAEKGAPTVYKGMFDALYKIGKYEGFRGLYKGFVPGMWGVSHGAIQFMAYEELKSAYNNYLHQPIDSKLGTLEYLGFSAFSKFIAAVTTYPYQVIRARLQNQNCVYEGAIDCVTQTLRHEGLRGFYKGLLPNLMRVVPATAITFLTYEKVSGYLLVPN